MLHFKPSRLTHLLGALRHGASPRRRWAVWLLVLAGTSIPTQGWDADVMLLAAQTQGPQAVVSTRALQHLLSTLGGRDDADKLAEINQFFNRRIAFASDMEVWGQLDYWASPLEMMQKGRGDCEDYAIGKYFTLLAAGVSTSRLRLVYVRAALQGALVAHMVLAYYSGPGVEPLILDSLVSDIRPASRRPDLTPVFSFNTDGLWQGTGERREGDPAIRLSRWRNVLAKARAEGFQ